MENTLRRTEPCPTCGSEMLWTQNAWPPDAHRDAAYRCDNGHVADPETTRQCPKCGIHDTKRVTDAEGGERFRCFRCDTSFTIHEDTSDGR